MMFFCFKQKTAYEMRISDWSSDVCSSDLLFISSALPHRIFPPLFNRYAGGQMCGSHVDNSIRQIPGGGRIRTDRKSVVAGESVSVRVDHGGRRNIIKKQRKVENNVLKVK